MMMPERPARDLAAEQIEANRRDGVICVRQLYSSDWVQRIAAFLDAIVARPSPIIGPRNNSKFHTDSMSWLMHDEVRDFILFGPGAWIAQQVFGSKCVNFYYDQIFVKEKLSPHPTPWHHDFTFWPLEGNQIASIWTSVDPVDAESSALEFVAGSHRWPQRFLPVAADGTIVTTDSTLEKLDIEGNRDKYNIVSWDLEPGDALLFHALTVHGARGNRSPERKRRAITTRWCGDDVIYRPRTRLEMHRHSLKEGDRFSDDIYPQVLPHIIESQIARRMAGPILPDPEVMADLATRASKFERVEVPLDF